MALAFARRFPGTVGFDIDCGRIEELRRAHDRNEETASAELESSTIELTCDASASTT